MSSSNNRIEIPAGKRSLGYRLCEILPGFLTYCAIALLFILSALNPLWASMYIMALILLMFVRAMALSFRTVQGYRVYTKSKAIDWKGWVDDLQQPIKGLQRVAKLSSKMYNLQFHKQNLQYIIEERAHYPKPAEITHAIFIAIYREKYEVVKPAVKALLHSDYDHSKIILVLACEERGGKAGQKISDKVRRDFGHNFADILTYYHPMDIAGEVQGKGPNISYAGEQFSEYVKQAGLNQNNIIVTTLDADNIVEPEYLNYLTYQWIVLPERHHVSFQPICFFTNNIWDVPAPMRVIAVGNSFWNVISSMRPHLLRNFASHAQSYRSLNQMDFWSKRTIVEDGHQYWRSFFWFKGDYWVVPLRIGIGQDAVMSNNYPKTLKAQFVQVRRWAYGCSDVAYVAYQIFSKNSTQPKPPFFYSFTRWLRLIESHVSQAIMAPVVAFGGWVPLLFSAQSPRSIVVHELPLLISNIQTVAIIGILLTVLTSLVMLPKRPPEYGRFKHFTMIIQWVLMPVTAILYSSASAFYAQTRLMFGRYMDVFDVTEKYHKQR